MSSCRARQSLRALIPKLALAARLVDAVTPEDLVGNGRAWLLGSSPFLRRTRAALDGTRLLPAPWSSHSAISAPSGIKPS